MHKVVVKSLSEGALVLSPAHGAGKPEDQLILKKGESKEFDVDTLLVYKKSIDAFVLSGLAEIADKEVKDVKPKGKEKAPAAPEGGAKA